MEKHPSRKHVSVIYIPIPKPRLFFPGLVEFFLQLLLPLRCLVDFRNLGYTVSLLLALFTALFLVRFLKIPAPELIVQATEAKAKAESLAAERAKDLQLLQENDRLRNEIKVLQEYKEKAHRELCRVRDEQKTFGKIKVKTKFNLSSSG